MLVESLGLESSYFIMSTKTGSIFLSSKRRCLVFYNELEAKGYCVGKEKDLYYERKEYDTRIDLVTDCFRQGAISIGIIYQGQKEELPISRQKIKQGYYNGRLNAAISLLKETKKMSYFPTLAASNYIVPVRMQSDPAAIFYGTVTSEKETEKKMYYLAFSDLFEYIRWEDDSGMTGWDPMLVNFNTMLQIAVHSNGYLVNCRGNQLILPYYLMKRQYEKAEKTKVEGGQSITHD